MATTAERFQFTHPGRGATISRPRAGVVAEVSIHAPREGCDLGVLDSPRPSVRRFNSRTPGGVRLMLISHIPESLLVSIHAPREGCDFVFNNAKVFLGVFQFTHPGRGATRETLRAEDLSPVSIHAPREGCDSCRRLYRIGSLSFNSRTPGGVRPLGSVCYLTAIPSFNSRTPGGVRLFASLRC